MELLETSANPLQLFRQAKKILKNTSRVNSPDWYRRANELNLQWHIWIGVEKVISVIHNKAQNEWYEGPNIPQLSFEHDETGEHIVGLDDQSRKTLQEILRQILKAKEFGGKPKSLGILMHLADALRVRDLDPDFAAEDDFENVNELLLSAPELALGDDSVASSDGVWRVLPLFGINEGEKRSVAVQVAGSFRHISDVFRDYGEIRNIPIVSEVVSSTLEALAGLPELVPNDKCLVSSLSLLQYEAFTLIAAIGTRGELLMVRPLAHRSGPTLTSAETNDYISQTAALLNMKAPSVVLISMTGIPVEELETLLTVYKELNSDTETYTVNSFALPFAENIPGNQFEFAFSTGNCGVEVNKDSPLFKAREKWATQDFNSPPMSELAKMPSRGDLKILKFAGIAQKVGIIALLGLVGWTGTEYITKLNSEAWRLNEQKATAMELAFAKLQKERKEWDYYENLFIERSEGWLAMETLLEIFPEKGGVILTSASYSSRAEDKTATESKHGTTRQWSLSGFANPEVAKELSSLGSRTKVAEMVGDIAEKNEADYLSVDSDSRDLFVNFEQKRGTMPTSKAFPTRVARYYRTGFDLTITQLFDASDELALNTTPSEDK